MNQLTVILKKFEKTLDIKNIIDSEKQTITKYAPYVINLGESIKNIKNRELSNKVLRQVLDKPSDNDSQFDAFMSFVKSYKEGEGSDSEYSSEDMKILFDKVSETNQLKNAPPVNEKFIEAHILMNVIENKYDFKTISEINCHYKDHELGVLKKKLDSDDNYWNMKSRKHYFSDKNYENDIQKRYKQITTPIPTIESLNLDKKNEPEKSDIPSDNK